MVDRDALRAEAVRIHGRYVTEVVEAFGFCPWAAGARLEGRVRTEAVLGDSGGADDARDPALLDDVLARARAMEADAALEIGLLVLPELTLGRVAFQHFAARVRARYTPAAAERAFAIADFHPDAEACLDDAARLVPFVRRSPDPSLQLVRRSAIEAVRLGAEPGTRFVDAAALAAGALLAQAPVGALAERVARANLRTVRALGVEQVRARLDAIAADRDRSYGRLGLPPPPWREVHEHEVR